MLRGENTPKKELETFNFNFFKKFDVNSLINVVKKFNDEWNIDTSRQSQVYEDRRNPHLFTNTYIVQDHDLFWKFGSMANPILKDEKIYKIIEESIIRPLEEEVVGRAARILLIKLNAKSDVSTHTDGGDYLSTVRRYHIPLITNDEVFYIVNEEKIHMKEGECWEINNFKPHSVVNGGLEDRIHLLIDIMPKCYFETLDSIMSNTENPIKIKIIEDFISNEDANKFIEYINLNQNNKEKFPLTRGEFELGRLSIQANIPESVSLSEHSEILDLIKKYSDKTLTEFKNFFKEDDLYISAFWMVLLGKDTKINAHRDNHIEAEHLYKSAVLYLSDDFDGGYLEFINNNLTLKPKKFSLIMFESTIEHRVTNIKRGARYALPMWASKGAKYNLFDNDNHPVKSNKDWHFAIKENKK